MKSFFSIAAHSTIEVVCELPERGHRVICYLFELFRERIAAAGAEFVSCDGLLSALDPKDEKEIGKDLSLPARMTAETALAMDWADFAPLPGHIGIPQRVCRSMTIHQRKFVRRRTHCLLDP